MTKKEWDEEFSQKITDLTGEIWTGRYDLKGLQTLENKIFAVICKDRKHQREEMKQESGLIVELNEKVIKKVIEDWLGHFRLFNDVLPGWFEDWKGDLVNRINAIATLSTALVNAKGILKWREEKGG